MIKLDTAIKLAVRAHDGQVDKIGDPYIFHVMRVAASFINEPFLQGIALLHDVIEDSDLTLRDLRDNGVSTVQGLAIDVLTRRKQDTYREYIERVRIVEAARLVKIADLRDNLQPRRLEALELAGTDTELLVLRYRIALDMLQAEEPARSGKPVSLQIVRD